MFTRADEPQSVGGILDSGFKLFTASIKQILPITYLGALAGAIWAWVFQKLVVGQVAESGELDFNVPQMVVGYIVMLIVGSIIMATAIIRIRAVFMSESMSLGDAFVAGVMRTPAIIGVTLLYMLALIVGSVLLVIPGLYLSITLVFGFFAASADKKGPVESIKYSHGLVKGNWWRTAGLLTVIMIIAMVFYVAVGFTAGLFAATQDSVAALEPNLLADVIIIPIITSAVTAMMYCLAYSVYHDLILRNEGMDLAARIESLE